MKNILLFLLLYPAITRAQLSKSFDSNNADVYKNIADVVIKSTDASFTYLQTDSTTDGDYITRYQTTKNDTLTFIVHHFLASKQSADLYSVTSIIATFELLFPFWKTHFEGEAKEATLLAYEHGIAYSEKKTGGHEKIFTFGKMEDNPLWRIRAKDW